jgi:hypothetical protein
VKAAIILTILSLFAVAGRAAETFFVSLAEAPKHGIRVEFVTPKVGIVQVTLHFTEAPPGVAVVIRDAKQEFIATLDTVINGKSCTVTLNEPYVARSYFLVPSRVKSGEPQMQLYLQ